MDIEPAMDVEVDAFDVEGVGCEMEAVDAIVDCLLDDFEVVEREYAVEVFVFVGDMDDAQGSFGCPSVAGAVDGLQEESLLWGVHLVHVDFLFFVVVLEKAVFPVHIVDVDIFIL